MAQKTVTLLPVLPIDIVVDEILPRLPARSLIRFKSVNKFFRTLISSQKFINLHLHQCLSSNTNRFLILGDNCSEQRLYWLDLDSPVACVIKLPCQQSSASRYYRKFVGSCNGLLCFAKLYFDKEDYEIVIVNPCTGMSKSGIPAPIGGRQVRTFSSLGFGYDSVKDDYKFVEFDAHFDDEIDHYIIQIMVYSMRADSWHRCITKTYTKEEACYKPGVLYKNHLIHWLIHSSSDHTQTPRIGCFNLETEQWTFYEVPLPQSQSFLFLTMINGYLGLFTWDDSQSYVWIMKEYGVRESWQKFLIYEYHPFNNSTFLQYMMVNAYRRETRKDELLVRITWKKISKDEVIATKEVHYWYDIRRQTYDRFKRIPPMFHVIASSIGSLVTC